MSFVCFDTRSHQSKRGGLVCVCVCVETHRLNKRPFAASFCTIGRSPHVRHRPHLWARSVNENFANSSSPPTITPSLSSRGCRWHFSPLAELLWLGYSCVEHGCRSAPHKWPQARFIPFSLFEKGGTLKRPVKRRPHPRCFFLPFQLICVVVLHFWTALFRTEFLAWHGLLGSVTAPRRQLGHVVYVRKDAVLTKKKSERQKTWERKRDRTSWRRSKQYRAVLFNTL